ncbi:NlpC/P60 family protein [Actinoplanes sp. NBC_00393]|uniref:C40 family peptidase n=1 Tax=Actinoplanes sp. NBC_00393 TaxID=2975953 RepID=UPI002E1EC7D0
MSKALRYGSPTPSRLARTWLRPLTISTATAVALAALLQPIPAMADPVGAPVAATPSVPDAGARPVQTGALILPGTPVRPTTTTPTLLAPGASASPIVQQVEKGRAEIAALGDQLIRIGQERDLAQSQSTTASQKITQAEEAIRLAKVDVATAADAAVRQAAALPPGALDADSGLLDLDALARLQRGDVPPDESAARRLKAAESNLQAARTEQTTASGRYTALAAQWTQLNTRITQKQAAQAKLEQKNAAELSAAETSENAADQQLGAEYLAGAADGRSADPKAIQALQFALAQRGDPYVWSEEGPDQYDCSGLMYAAYRSVGFPLVRVSRDQYYQTRNKVVDRYSLLPGDLLFFSSSNSWTGIHHVAMYAGNGMMVEAPRTGLNVRLVPVRWSRLFQSTRVFGSVEGEGETPDLGTPDPEEPGTNPNPNPTSPTPRPTTPTPSKSSTPTRPTTSPTTSTSPTTPTSPSSPPPTSPSPSASSSSPPPKPSESASPAAPSTTPAPQETSEKPTTSPSAAETSKSPSGTTSSANAAESSVASTAGSKSPSGSASKSASPSASSDEK